MSFYLYTEIEICVSTTQIKKWNLSSLEGFLMLLPSKNPEEKSPNVTIIVLLSL